MRAYYFDKDIWTGTDSLWAALGLTDRMRQTGAGPFVISFTGAGGKTSSIRRLAREAMDRGLKTLVATTTHMARPTAFGVFTGDCEAVARAMEDSGLVVAGRLAGDGKIAFVGRELYEKIVPLADLVLVEADGSRRLPLKVPGTNEPVIPGNTDLILCLAGLSSMGRPADECCLRLEQARTLMDSYGRRGYETGGPWMIRRDDIMCLMKYGYLDPLRRRFPGAKVMAVFNQADPSGAAHMVREMLDAMGESRGVASGRLAQDPSAGLF